MKKPEGWKIGLFAVGLAVLALIVNSTMERFWYRHSDFGHQVGGYQSQQMSPRPTPVVYQPHQSESRPTRTDSELKAAEERRIASETAAAQRLQYLNRYLDSTITRTPGMKTVALAAVNELGKRDHVVSSAFTPHLANPNVKIISGLFKQEFVFDGLFAKVFDGSTEALAKLELTNSLDALLMARMDVRYSTNRSLENVITANMYLEAVLLPVAGDVQSRTWKYTANGAGFRPGDARAMAEERLLKQIAKEKNISF